MFARKDITPDVLRQLLECCFDTGKLYWKKRDVGWFHSERSSRAWNKRYAGREAFTYVDVGGYHCGHVLGYRLYAHRVVFAMYHGEWPDRFIDHENGCKTDNRPSNLRDVSRAENARNTVRPSDNSSGFIGVHWAQREGKWRACIGLGPGQSLYLGSFAELEDAVRARKDAEKRFGFHPNHGRPSD